MVQSVCLTSRGSGVRLPLLPPKAIQETGSLFFVHPPPNPRPSATKRHQPRIGGLEFRRNVRTEMPDDVKDGIGMPLGAVAKRLGVKGKTLACQRRGFDSLCSHRKAIQETGSLFFVHPAPNPRPSATKRLFCRVHLSPGTFHAKHRAGVSALRWRRMAFLLLDEVEMAASSRQISPTAP